MLRIRRSEVGGFAVLALSGRIGEQDVAELQKLLDAESEMAGITMDLEEVRLVDRQVVRFLAACEAQGVSLKNCPPYVREWIERGDKP
jgi:predicted metal-binding protein